MSYFARVFGQFESSASFQKWVDKPYTKAVKQDVFNKFFQSTTIK